MSRLDDLREKLDASLDGETRKPKPGYIQRVAALRAEIARLESGTARAEATSDSVGVDTPAEQP